jgi:hypothetical protein
VIGHEHAVEAERFRALVAERGVLQVELAGDLRARRAHRASGGEAAKACVAVNPSAVEAERFLLGIAGWMMDGLDEAGRATAIGDLRASLAAHETARGVVYDSATWIVTARRP